MTLIKQESHLLTCDSCGYESYWRVPDRVPDWVLEWDEEAHNGMSFEHYIDNLTYEDRIQQ